MNSKKTTTAIALSLLFAMTFSLVALPNANAHTPPWEITTHAYISVAPDPVGVGQQVLVVVWLDQTIAGVSIANNIRFQNYKLTITKPDGDTEIINWPTVSDPTSSAFTQYTVTQTGKYTFKFEFPGQLYTYTEPMIPIFGPPQPNTYTNDTYLASSATTTLVVQEEPVEKLPETPLPTEYWTRAQ
jgi:hypothetical protein